MAKILLIVAIIVSLATAGIGFLNKQKFGDAALTLETTQASLKNAQEALEAAKTEVTTAQEQIATVTAEKETAESDLATAKADLAKVSEELSTVKGDVTAKVSQIEQLTGEVDTLKAQVAQFAAASTPTEETAAPQDDAKVAELETLVSSLQARNTQLTSEVDALKQDAENRKNVAMREGLEGRVLAVNPAYNFVVLSIGDRNGVVNNAELLLKRGGQYLGKVKITSVEPSTSIADIVANSLPQGVAVQPGDSVIFQSSTN